MLARRIFLAGILAGLVAGAFVTVIQAIKIWPLIAAAEVYEKAGEPAASGHDHAGVVPTTPEWEPSEGVERAVFTLLANVLVATGFGLLLSAGFALRDAYGGVAAGATNGLFWGMAGFAAFQLAPSFGLAPEPPGAVAADLLVRQGWWMATAVATASGIALIAFSTRPAWKLAGTAAIVAPHVLGAPLPEHAGGSAPPELAAQFVAASLVTAALFWLVLGGFGGWIYGRLSRSA
jgi:cobalt transporter subunit CbtA